MARRPREEWLTLFGFKRGDLAADRFTSLNRFDKIRFGDFVCRTGYRDHPTVDEEGRLVNVLRPGGDNHIMLQPMHNRMHSGLCLQPHRTYRIDMKLHPLQFDNFQANAFAMCFQVYGPDVAYRNATNKNPPVSLYARNNKWNFRLLSGMPMEPNEHQDRRVQFDFKDEPIVVAITYKPDPQDGFIELRVDGKELVRFEGCTLLTRAPTQGGVVMFGAYSNVVNLGFAFDYFRLAEKVAA